MHAADCPVRGERAPVGTGMACAFSAQYTGFLGVVLHAHVVGYAAFTDAGPRTGRGGWYVNVNV